MTETESSTHLFRTETGVHTQADMALFAGAKALARALGLPDQQAGSCDMRAVVMQHDTLRVEFHGISTTVQQQQTTFRDALINAGIGDDNSLPEHQFRIPKVGNGVCILPSDHDYDGHSVDICISQNGGSEKLAQALQDAAKSLRPNHSARIDAGRIDGGKERQR